MASNPLTVFCFHRISDEYSPAYPPIPVKVFDRICRYILKHYQIIHPFEINKEINTTKKRALITFDDAYLDFYKNALPILKKHQIPAIQHVITECANTGNSFWTQRLNKIIEAYYEQQQVLDFDPLDIHIKFKKSKEIEPITLTIFKHLLPLADREIFIKELEANLPKKVSYTPMMTWKELKEVTHTNIVIGSHTHTHENLTTLPEELIGFELQQSKELIEKHIGKQEQLFLAYPNGQTNTKVKEMSQNYGYNLAFTTEEKSITQKISFELPRFQLYHSSWWKNYLRFLLHFR